jgi:outer membrane protein assembly factor BamB
MRKGPIGLLVLVAGWTWVAGQPGQAADWPRFRGPNGTGISTDKDIPVRWNAESGVLWSVAIPGHGNSSPIIWGQQVFVQTASDDGAERSLICLSAVDGRTLWTAKVQGRRARTHKKNTMASSTPATDGERVYAMSWDGTEVSVHGYDMKGKHLWKQPLGGFTSQHGPGTSPIVVGDKVILADDQDGSATLYALDAKTGQIAWQRPRKGFRTCYSTPFVLEQPGQSPELIVVSTAGITSYQPQTGAENWSWTWRFDSAPLRTVASPVFSQGLIFANSGDGAGDRHTVAVRAGGKGDVSATNLVWENKKKLALPYVPSFLAWGEHLYWVDDKGYAACYVARTGEQVWRERLGNTDISASPILVNGKIYAVNEAGTVYVLEAAPAFKLLAKNAVGEQVKATPAVADGRLLIRGESHLFCIGKPPAK